MMVQRGEIHISKRRSEIHSKKSEASFLVEVALLNSGAVPADISRLIRRIHVVDNILSSFSSLMQRS